MFSPNSIFLLWIQCHNNFVFKLLKPNIITSPRYNTGLHLHFHLFCISPKFYDQLYCQEKNLFVKVSVCCWILMAERKPQEDCLEVLIYSLLKELCSLPLIELYLKALLMINWVSNPNSDNCGPSDRQDFELACPPIQASTSFNIFFQTLETS